MKKLFKYTRCLSVSIICISIIVEIWIICNMLNNQVVLNSFTAMLPIVITLLVIVIGIIIYAISCLKLKEYDKKQLKY